MRQIMILLSILLFGTALLLVAGIAGAQDQVVTADDVNAIAKKLYCPVCENIPLDTCGTAACQDWRYEIQLQLEDGLTEQEIIDDFVRRFGDRVVGTPQDPLLRAISVATPWIFTIVASLIVIFGLIRLRLHQPNNTHEQDDISEISTDRYQDLLEQDLSG